MKTHYHFHFNNNKSACIHIHLNNNIKTPEIIVEEKEATPKRFMEKFYNQIKKYIDDKNF